MSLRDAGNLAATHAEGQGGDASFGVGSSDVLVNDDLSYFIDKGLWRLLSAMLQQSLKDLIEHRKNARAPAETSMSSRWLETDLGRSSIEFLMPGVSVDRVIARIHQDPEDVLAALHNSQSEREADQEKSGPVAVLKMSSGDHFDETAMFDGAVGYISPEDSSEDAGPGERFAS